MKKLLAGFCSVLLMHSFSQASPEVTKAPGKADGQKNLIKAISVIINTEANKKAPVKTIQVFSSELPY